MITFVRSNADQEGQWLRKVTSISLERGFVSSIEECECHKLWSRGITFACTLLLKENYVVDIDASCILYI